MNDTPKKPAKKERRSLRSRIMRKKTAIIVLEVAAVFAVVLAVAVSAAAWRLSKGPIDVTFAKDYIASSYERAETQTVDVGKMILQWPNFEGPLLLGLSNLKITDAQGQEIFAINQAGLTLSKRHLLIGQVKPLALIIRKPILRAVRNVNGEFDFGFSSSTPQEPSNEGSPFRSLIDTLLDKEDTSMLSSLKAIQIESAQFHLQNLKNKEEWSLPNMNFALKRVRDGVNAEIYISLDKYGPVREGDEEKSGYIQAEALLRHDANDVEISTQFKSFDLRLLGNLDPALEPLLAQNVVIDGLAFANTSLDMSPKSAGVSMRSTQGAVMIDGEYDAPLPYKDFVLDASYDARSEALTLKDLDITLRDVPIKGSADIKITPDSITGPVKLSISQLAHEQIPPLWPQSLVGDNSEEWVVKKLSKGNFSDVFAHGNLVFKKQTLEGSEGWDVDVQGIEAGFNFENLSVDYRPPMTPVTNAKGKGALNQKDDTLIIDVESGTISELSVKNATLKFDQVITEGKGNADIKTALTGPLSSAIDYVSKEPIALNHGFDMSRVKGGIDFTADVNFPTTDIDIEDVSVKVKGTARDTLLPAVVDELDLTGGPFDITVEGNNVIVDGAGQLAGRPVTARYEAFLNSEGQAYKSKTTASLSADPNLRAHFGIDLSDFIEGAAPIDVIYTEFANDRAEVDVSADLTPLKIMVDPFQYTKPPGQEASAKGIVHIQNDKPVKITKLSGQGPNLNVIGATLKFRNAGGTSELASGALPKFTIGQSRGAMDFDIEPTGRMKFIINASQFDARPFLDADKKADTDDDSPLRVSLSATQMITPGDQDVTNVKVYVDMDGEGRFNQFEVDALTSENNVSGKVFLRFKPDANGARTFKFQADDAGAALKAFGTYDNMRGGKLSIYGEPVRGANDRDILGVGEITDFKVVNAPVLGRLLSALSLPGVLNLLSDEGVSFSKLESKFNWNYRKGGSLLTLEEGRTSGSALGFTFDGTYDSAERALGISGTIVPISGLNKALSSIPLVGTILSGGSDSIFAATYTIKGDAENPEIIVNPLAVLAPGLLRRILFE